MLVRAFAVYSCHRPICRVGSSIPAKYCIVLVSMNRWCRHCKCAVPGCVPCFRESHRPPMSGRTSAPTDNCIPAVICFRAEPHCGKDSLLLHFRKAMGGWVPGCCRLQKVFRQSCICSGRVPLENWHWWQAVTCFASRNVLLLLCPWCAHNRGLIIITLASD